MPDCLPIASSCHDVNRLSPHCQQLPRRQSTAHCYFWSLRLMTPLSQQLLFPADARYLRVSHVQHRRLRLLEAQLSEFARAIGFTDGCPFFSSNQEKHQFSVYFAAWWMGSFTTDLFPQRSSPGLGFDLASQQQSSLCSTSVTALIFCPENGDGRDNRELAQSHPILGVAFDWVLSVQLRVDLVRPWETPWPTIYKALGLARGLGGHCKTWVVLKPPTYRLARCNWDLSTLVRPWAYCDPVVMPLGGFWHRHAHNVSCTAAYVRPTHSPNILLLQLLRANNWPGNHGAVPV
ncbi:hypothetical protein B0H14DRAFT_2561907 [Mycena olivaceomarginata]|nr:hypothetical protein B0H14DRAFT_2561907 [Mycena olivaceomarginata]